MAGDSFELYSALCPGGYTLSAATISPDIFVCICDTVKEILQCEDDQDTIIIQVKRLAASSASNVSISLMSSLGQGDYWAPYRMGTYGTVCIVCVSYPLP